MKLYDLRVVFTNSKGEIRDEFFRRELGKNETLGAAGISIGVSGGKVVFRSDNTVNLVSAQVKTDRSYSNDTRIYCNGFQSWTDSREFMITEKMKPLSKWRKVFAPWACCEPYGDYNFVHYDQKKGHVHSFDHTYLKRGATLDFVGSINERTGYTIFKHFPELGYIAIDKDVEGVILPMGAEYELFNLVELSGGYDEVFDKYFALLNVKPPREKFVSGFTTWYNYYTNISRDIIKENVDNIVKGGYGMKVFQVDDGFQTETGDWLSWKKDTFPDGMKPVADYIKSKGMIPGLWLAPLAVVKNSETFKAHPEWTVKDKNGKPSRCGNNWGGFYALDVYNEGAAGYIEHFFDVVLNEWGFDLVKLDFLYAGSLAPRNGKSRAEIMYDTMEFIRKCCGEKYILGCGVPLMPAFGLVDFCRVTCDVSERNWVKKGVSKLLHREDVCTSQATYTSVYRRYMDGRAFLNDPDVYHLRTDNMYLTKDQQWLLATINHMFGHLLFTSDNVGKYDAEQKAWLREMTAPMDIKIIDVTNEKPFIIKIEYAEKGVNKVLEADLKNGRVLAK